MHLGKQRDGDLSGLIHGKVAKDFQLWFLVATELIPLFDLSVRHPLSPMLYEILGVGGWGVTGPGRHRPPRKRQTSSRPRDWVTAALAGGVRTRQVYWGFTLARSI